jgi:hypothetical protein
VIPSLGPKRQIAPQLGPGRSNTTSLNILVDPAGSRGIPIDGLTPENVLAYNQAFNQLASQSDVS